ncbi:MAG TPA: hypothetical protein GX502_00365 [Syntrophaceticus sp.]|nr:hypothetical protein [Syntrophaceticus sp.]
MKLSANLAQNIVKNSMEIIKKNINILDENGIIIASGDQSRINTFHEPSLEVIKTGKTVEIDKEQSSKIDGVLPGISLPITFGDKIIGVVGITGDPEEVRVYAQLLKNTVELMLQDAFLRQQLQVETGARDRFIHDLLKGRFENDMDLFRLRAKTLGCDIEVPRVAMVIDIIKIGGVPLQDWVRCNAGRELKLESMTSDVQRRLRQINEETSMITRVGRDRFAILYNLPKGLKDEQLKNHLDSVARKLSDMLDKVFKMTVSIGIGNKANNYEEYSKSYREACLVLKITRKIWGTPSIYYWDDIGVNIILEYLPENIEELIVKTIKVLDDNLKETVKTFFDCNLSVNKTANKLFVHRNTLTYRLDRVNSLTGLDPRNFYDAMYLYLAIMLEKYNN